MLAIIYLSRTNVIWLLHAMLQALERFGCHQGDKDAGCTRLQVLKDKHEPDACFSAYAFG